MEIFLFQFSGLVSRVELLGHMLNIWLIFWGLIKPFSGFPGGGASGKEPTGQGRRPKRHEFDPWIWEDPWRRTWQPTLIALPGESHGQRRLAGYSPQGRNELNMTEVTSHANHFHCGCTILQPHQEFQFSSVQSLSCLTLCDPMNCSTPGLPVHHQLLEFTQTHVHRVGDAILSLGGFNFLHILTSICYCLFYFSHLGEGNGTPLQYSCLENPMDGGAW